MIQKFPITTGGLLMTAALLCLVLWAAPGLGSKPNAAPARKATSSATVQAPSQGTNDAAQAANEAKR
jgi:hypothetical protein